MTEEIKKEDKVNNVDPSQNLQNDTPTDIGEDKKNVTTEENTSNDDNKKEEVKKDDSKELEDKKDDKKDFQRKPFKKNFRKRKPFKREKPEFDQKILSLRRVTRVMAGGRRFSFAVAMVVGDKKGRVGFGTGKSNDTVAAIEKAVRNAKKTMVRIKITEDGSIPYDVSAKYKSSEIQIRPIKGKGLAAGGAVRTVLEFAGIRQAGAKILSRSKNHINNAKAALKALEPFSEKIEVKALDKKKKFGDSKKFIRKPRKD